MPLLSRSTFSTATNTNPVVIKQSKHVYITCYHMKIEERTILRGSFKLHITFGEQIQNQDHAFDNLYDLWFFEAKRITK